MEKKSESESEVSPGSLYASGLIAAGGVFGLLAIVINLLQDPELAARAALAGRGAACAVVGGLLCRGGKVHAECEPEPVAGGRLFVALAVSLFVSARKKLKQS